MDTGIPAVVSLPLLVFVGSILVVRLTTLRSTKADRTLNTALVFVALFCLLRDRTAQSAIVAMSGKTVSPAFLYQLGELAAIPPVGALVLLGYTWMYDTPPRYLVRLVYSGLAICTLVTFVLELQAGKQDYPQHVLWWAVITYRTSPTGMVAALALIFHNSLAYWSSMMIIFTCVRELWRRPSRRVVAVCAAMGTVGLGVLGQTLGVAVSTAVAVTAQNDGYINGGSALDRFTLGIWAYIGAGVAAVPVFARMLDRLQLNGYALRRKHLLPLWSDLTAACPEIVYSTREPVISNRSRYLLHRTVVEIRDCMLMLSHYARHRDEVVARRIAGDPTLPHAIRLALAWSAKSLGGPPSDDLAAHQSAAKALLDETDELAKLADHWVRAKALAADATHTTTHLDT